MPKTILMFSLQVDIAAGGGDGLGRTELHSFIQTLIA